ncbi:MAG: DUF7677 family protein [Ardenticatenaceae bacterium]
MKLSEDFRRKLRHLAYYLTNGTLGYVIEDEVLKGYDFFKVLTCHPHMFEYVFALYGNVIELDYSGNVLNHTHAMTRVAQYIALYSEGGLQYKHIPEFEEWETYLH